MSQSQAQISLKFQPVAEANPPWSLRFFHHLLVKARQVEFALGVVQKPVTQPCRAVTIANCVLSIRFKPKTLQANPGWKATARNQAALQKAPFSGSADVLLFHMKTGSLLQLVTWDLDTFFPKSLSPICYNFLLNSLRAGCVLSQGCFTPYVLSGVITLLTEGVASYPNYIKAT